MRHFFSIVCLQRTEIAPFPCLSKLLVRATDSLAEFASSEERLHDKSCQRHCWRRQSLQTRMCAHARAATHRAASFSQRIYISHRTVERPTVASLPTIDAERSRSSAFYYFFGFVSIAQGQCVISKCDREPFK